MRARQVHLPNSPATSGLATRMRFRHPGHRYEWTRRQFRDRAEGVGSRSGYQASFHDIGGSHLRLGGATQMAVLSRT